MRAGNELIRSGAAAGRNVRQPAALLASGAFLAAATMSSIALAAPAPQWVTVASEGGSFSTSGSQSVRYGVSGKWVQQTRSGAVACSNASFGRDPVYGTVKHCDVYKAPASVATPASVPVTPTALPTSAPASDTLTRNASRLAMQASFGNTEALTAEIKTKGAAGWIASQMLLPSSRYTSGGNASVHQNTSASSYCELPSHAGPNCWRDNQSSIPLVWDFYRNATMRPDQLRQRVAFALQQIFVVSGVDLDGTYGLRNYQNTLLDNAFGNYRQVLKQVALSPVMGDYLNNVNNDKAAPNENFAREFLQLFSVGTCLLNADGSLRGGACAPTYDNDTVRAYAYALTGWTYPAGGATAWGCWPEGTNCRFHNGDMVAVAARHDNASRQLLAGTSLRAGLTAPAALEVVLDSLMAHPNTAPFIGKQLIQQLVSSNPSPAYVSRVSAAFIVGKYATFGTGQRGDLAATVAAVLLDPEARSANVTANGGKLRDPVLMFTSVLRGLNGYSDGESLSWWWGEELREHVFRPPTVFSFYSPDYPVPGTTLVGPSFGIHNAGAALQRLNFLIYLLEWGGSTPTTSVPNATGTKVDLSRFTADAADAGKLVDRLSLIATGQPLPAATRTEIIKAVSWWTAATDKTNWQSNRVKTAAYLVFATPNFQVER